MFIKEAKPMGNSAAVYVPKEWAHQKIVITLLSPKEMALEALKPHMPNIISACLYGSHARGDAGEDSDVDVLAITSKEIKVECKPPLDVLALSEERLVEILEEDPIQVTPIIREAVPILNESYLESLKAYDIKPRGYLKLVKDNREKIREHEKLIAKKTLLDYVVYSLVMRLRAVYSVNLILSKKEYTKKAMTDYVKGIGMTEETYENMHRIYVAARDQKPLPKNVVTLDEIEELRRLVEKENNQLEARLKNAR
ncbi:MAG: DUF2080 family transposase-associated protein [Candidatus Altiarchaeota archaeon]